MYKANQLHERLMAAFQNRYPGFRAMRFIFSSEPGGGKSTILASVPVVTGRARVIMDNEDSMAYLDAGKEGVDVYTPNRLQFRMSRKVFPILEDYAVIYEAIKRSPVKAGAFCVDNIAIFQDLIVEYVAKNASAPANVRTMLKHFDADTNLPNDGLIKTWVYNHDGNFWKACKEIPKAFLFLCMKNGIHFLGSTEEGNVWQNYGTKEAKITGKRAKIWDVWMRYTDSIISLVRDVNKREPPFGQLYPNQPKMRLQGLNPKFRMDWEGFAIELEAAAKRTEVDIPKEAQVVMPELVEESGGLNRHD